MTSLPTPPETSPEPQTYIVEWYRMDQSREVMRVLFVAAPLLLIGCLCVAFAWLATHRTPIVRVIVGTFGAIGNVGGPLYAIFGLRSILMKDSYVALRTDGVVLREGNDETGVLWDDIAEVRFADDRIEFVKRDGEVLAITQKLAGITLKELAKRIEHVRKRMAFGMTPRAQKS